MKTHARVVIIGGGVVGASVLYHLTKLGWTDVVLLEKHELTSGSTWHAAGGVHTYNSDANVSRLQKYTIDLYHEIERISGQSCGIHATGNLVLAASQAMLDNIRMMHSRGRYLGLEMRLISPREAKELNPLIDDKEFIGALHRTDGGHVDPHGVTHAYAIAARKAGAEIHRFTRVVELESRPDGGWRVVTDQGDIVCEHVVNAAGLWAREVGHMAGIELPVLAMEHMYIVTEDIPEVVAFGRELLPTSDYSGEIYMRQERNGVLMGTYEQDCRVWSPEATPWEFNMQLLPDDLDRVSSHLEVGFKHFPAIGRAGIKKVVNGPFTFAPDGNPLVGPVRGLRNYWCACGVMAGFAQGGGVGLALSRWIVEGDPESDLFAMDVARYGPFATRTLHERQGAGELPTPLPDGFPQRGAARRPSAAAHPCLRPVAGRGRGIRRQFRPRGRALVRAEGHGAGRSSDVPPLERVSRGSRRLPCGAQRRRPHGNIGVRQI